MTLGDGRKISLVTGICIDRDAISNVVMTQRATLVDAGFDVRVYAQHVDRGIPNDVVCTSDPWTIQLDPHFAASDLVLYHFGIKYELFDSLALAHPRARRVVHFHNITPPALLDGQAREAARAGLAQLALATEADRIWCDSPYNGASLLEYADVDPDRIRIVALGLPVEPSVEARPSRGPGDRINLLSVGRFVRAKGLQDLLTAFEAIEPEVRSHVQARFAGSTSHADPAHVEEVERRAEALGAELLFDLSDDDLAALYRSSDIFVSPSHHEGFCLPVVEALAAGCRVITTDAGALPDTLGQCGTIVGTGDTAAMAGAITAEVLAARSMGHDKTATATEQARVERTRKHLDHFGAAAVRRRFLHEIQSVLACEPMTETHLAGSISPDLSQRFARHQQRLLERLACPTCHRPPNLASPVWIGEAVESGALACPDHGLVGVIGSYRPSFLARELDRVRIDGEQVLTVLDLERDVTRIGEWTTVPQGALSLGAPGDALVFDAIGQRARIEFFGHDHSGAVRIQAEGVDALDIDLHRSHAEPVSVTLDELGPGRHRVHIVPMGASAAGPHTAQMVVARIETQVDAGHRRVADLSAINRGNAYPDRFIELVDEMPDDAMILDCGGGDRRFGDDRVYNLEYLEFQLPDLFGDGLCLPFRDDSFDLIMSQAVLEHVPDPQRAVDEMTRVLKPGGQIYIEIAFMQPLHAVPSHYMNVTPHGIAHLCRNLEVLESGTFGGLAVTFEWIAQLANADERLGAERLGDLLASLRHLDDQLSPEELDQFASAVYLLGRKRPE